MSLACLTEEWNLSRELAFHCASHQLKKFAYTKHNLYLLLYLSSLANILRQKLHCGSGFLLIIQIIFLIIFISF